MSLSSSFGRNGCGRESRQSIRPPRHLLTWLLPILFAVPGALPGACDPPTLTTITTDGLMDDWGEVLSNPENLTLDGPGYWISCSATRDRDCPIPLAAGSDVDLRRFAWTYDDMYLYLFVERYGTAGGWHSIFLHLDLDRTGGMEAGPDRIVRINYHGSSGDVQYEVFRYRPADPFGDLLEDASGFADGHSMPGSIGTELHQSPTFLTGTPDGERFEIAIDWADLDQPGPVPALFHAGADEKNLKFDQAKDNLGGSDGRAGDMGFYAFDLAAPEHDGIPPGSTVLYGHSLVNHGNLPDTYRLWAFSSEGCELRFLSDPNGDGDPSDGSLLGLDVDGDGDFMDGGDQVLSDSDGDTWPDTGLLGPGETFSFLLQITPRGNLRNATDLTDLFASATAGGCSRQIQDQTHVGHLTLLPRHDIRAEPGSGLVLRHDLQNHMALPSCVDLTATSALGWDWQTWSDPDGDGDPADGSPLADTCGGPEPDLQVLAGESVSLLLRADIPPGTALGAIENLIVDAEGSGTGRPAAVVADTVTVAETLELSPSYLLAEGEAKSAPAGRSVFFRHRLTWSGPQPESFTLSATSPPGQLVTLLSDPNGDGLPGDGTVLPDGSTVGPLEPFGGSFPLVARLDVADGTPRDSTLSFDIWADSVANPGISRTVMDEAVVTLVAAYADPLLLFQENHFPRCGTVWALATGLVPIQSGRYRFRWVEEAGPSTIRSVPFDSDAAGEGVDTLDVDPAFALGDYRLLLESWDGLQWSELDSDALDLQDFWEFQVLRTNRTTYTTEGDLVLVAASFENAGPSVLRDTLLHYRILDPTGMLYLMPDGSFAPFGGTEWTWTTGPLDMVAGERSADAFGIGPVSFPQEGTYSLEVHAVGGCAEAMESAATTFEVLTDSDGDGWSDDHEIARGTDPNDRDSDDDGIPDPQDGDGDADGDTLVDALDCDADADTLPDSVEVGLDGTALDSDTDTAAGCFQPDADAGATTTDPHRADTDGGGEDDGAEDLDRDGEIDPSEKDPRDAADDRCAWLPPPEVSGVRVSRSGDDLMLSWGDLSPSDPCVAYRVLVAADSPPDDLARFQETASGLFNPVLSLPGAATAGSRAFFLLQASGPIGGNGPVGHYAQ